MFFFFVLILTCVNRSRIRKNRNRLIRLIIEVKFWLWFFLFPAAAHTLGFSHCNKFANRIYNFSRQNPVDPTLNKAYAAQLQAMCPKKVDPRIAINMDPNTPRTFDNAYYKNLVEGKGLFTSDQILFTDPRSKSTVMAWAGNKAAFEKAFIAAMTKLGRVGVKTGTNGNIRRNCAAFNWSGPEKEKFHIWWDFFWR